MIELSSSGSGLPVDVPEGAARPGLLLSRDLIFTSKITGTARALGQRVLVAGNIGLAATMIEQWKPLVVFVDLAAADLASLPTLAALIKLGGPETPFVAFGSHVDLNALEAAKSAGCAQVMPRSKFTNVLPDLVRQYFGILDADAQKNGSD